MTDDSLPENYACGWAPAMQRSGLRPTLAIAACALMLASCGGRSVRHVTPALSAEPPSLTDDVSRQLAQRSLLALEQQTEDYRIGPGDLLEISIFEWELREETKTASFRVAESGVISLPVIQDILVSGLSVREVKGAVESKLRSGGFLLQPRVSVDIAEFRSRRVAVVGAVNDPGVYTLRQNVSTLLDMLSLAGGASERAGSLANVIRTRVAPEERVLAATLRDGADDQRLPNQAVMAIDLYELLDIGNLELNVVLRDGDIVSVPEAKRFAVIGWVNAAGTFPLKRPTTVLEAVALAGGLQEGKASSGAALLKRRTEMGDIIVPVDVGAVASGRAPNMFMQPDDVLHIRRTGARRAVDGLYGLLTGIFSVGYNLGDLFN